MKTGIELITEERQRQIEQEGWTAGSDDLHCQGEMAAAGACYAKFAASCARMPANSVLSRSPFVDWPWHRSWWKPTGGVRDLVKAGALIAAEIDRLQRKEAQP